MDLKPFSVVFFCSFCAAGNVALAAGGASAPDALQAGNLPVAMGASSGHSPGMLALSSLMLDSSSSGDIALSVSERLQLREQIRKAAEDIYSDTQHAPSQRDASRAQDGKVPVSP